MNTRRMRVGLAVIAAVASLILAGCAPVKTGTTGAIGQGDPVPLAQEDPAIAAMVPQKYRERGYLEVVTSIGMAPLNIPDTATGEIEGFNADMARQVAAVLDLQARISGASIDQILPGMDAGRYDVTFSNMAITEERLAVLDFTEYYFSASGLGVLEGNKLGLNPDNLCGHSVGASNGSFQMTKVLPKLSEKCVEEGKPAIQLQAYPDQQKAALALLSGRVESVCMDGPVLSYAITQEPRIEYAGKMTEGSNLGIGVRKGDPLVEAVSAAVIHLMDTGVYQQLLQRYGIEDLAIEGSKVHK